jgi:hypothetical protein
MGRICVMEHHHNMISVSTIASTSSCCTYPFIRWTQHRTLRNTIFLPPTIQSSTRIILRRGQQQQHFRRRRYYSSSSGSMMMMISKEGPNNWNQSPHPTVVPQKVTGASLQASAGCLLPHTTVPSAIVSHPAWPTDRSSSTEPQLLSSSSSCCCCCCCCSRRKKRILILCTGGTMTMVPDMTHAVTPQQGALSQYILKII